MPDDSDVLPLAISINDERLRSNENDNENEDLLARAASTPDAARAVSVTF